MQPMAGQWQQEEQVKPGHMISSICAGRPVMHVVVHVVPQESISMECCAMHEDGQGGFDRSRGRLLSATVAAATACHPEPLPAADAALRWQRSHSLRGLVEYPLNWC